MTYWKKTSLLDGEGFHQYKVDILNLVPPLYCLLGSDNLVRHTPPSLYRARHLKLAPPGLTHPNGVYLPLESPDPQAGRVSSTKHLPSNPLRPSIDYRGLRRSLWPVETSSMLLLSPKPHPF